MKSVKFSHFLLLSLMQNPKLILLESKKLKINVNLENQEYFVYPKKDEEGLFNKFYGVFAINPQLNQVDCIPWVAI